MKNKELNLKLICTAFLLLFLTVIGSSQTLPYTFTNDSDYPDDQVYVAIVGITGGHVWVDPIDGSVHQMSLADNTVAGPVNGGNMGPGNNGLYANCFRPLSQIPNKVVNIPKIAGCRIFMSFGSPLYLYFFGYSGDPQGYAAPNLSNETDPNQGIKFEIMELTYNNYGLWINSTRVDCYQYPMGLEVWGTDGFYKKVGELKTHSQIISEWQATAPAEFQGLLNTEHGIIHFPTKDPSWDKGLIQTYIDQVWAKYSGQQLVFSSGDAGVWRGSVSGNNFVFTRDSDGQVATIAGKPTTLEAMEALGIMAQGNTWDLVVQAQIAAAINRHAINLSLGSGVVQDFGSPSNYYQTWPYNWYAKFWHRTDISYEGQTYAFSYDDVFDQSATVHTPNPQSIKITLGGFKGNTDDNGDDNGDNNNGNGILIQAENYANMSGVEVENCSDTDGGQNVGWIDTGDWMVWDVNIPNSGTYTVNYRVASANGGGTIQLEKAGGNPVYGSITVPSTGGWQNWTTISHEVDFSVGAQQIAIYVPAGGYNINWISIESAVSESFTIEAENYATMSGIDVENCSDNGGGQNVGWIDAGDWMVWDINPANSGTFNVEYRVASANGGGTIQLEKAGGNPVYGSIAVPSTGGWQTWTTISHQVNLTAGAQQIAIYVPAGGFNINRINFTLTTQKSAAVSSKFKYETQVKTYPNPVNDILNIELGEHNYQYVQIFDLTGKLLINKNINGEQMKFNVSVASLNEGVYMLRLANNNEAKTLKIIKQ